MRFKLPPRPKDGDVKTNIEFFILHIDEKERTSRVLEFAYVVYRYDDVWGWICEDYLENKPDWKSIFRYYFLRKI